MKTKIMQTMVEGMNVTAVRLGDGWHNVRNLVFYGDPLQPAIAGAQWDEPNDCVFTCPMLSILAVREGTPVEDADAASTPRLGRPNDKLRRAIEWLESSLQDGECHSSKVLIQDAKAAEGINEMTLRRAKDVLKVLGFKAMERGIVHWYWQMEPMSEVQADDDAPLQSQVIQYEGAE